MTSGLQQNRTTILIAFRVTATKENTVDREHFRGDPIWIAC